MNSANLLPLLLAPIMAGGVDFLPKQREPQPPVLLKCKICGDIYEDNGMNFCSVPCLKVFRQQYKELQKGHHENQQNNS